MEENNKKHNPAYIPQIGIPEKNNFQERNYTRAIYHKATAPGFFGVVVMCFFMSFINIKCNGRLMASYTGMEIVRGVDKSNIDGEIITGVRQSAYNQFRIAKENFKWKRDLEDNYEEHVNNSPYSEDDFSAIDDFYKMPENFEETTTNPKRTRALATIALISALVGFVFALLKGKWGTFAQIIAGLTGFIAMMLIQLYVKITLPKTTSPDSPLYAEYTAPMVTTEFALGYWLALSLFLGVAIIGFLKLRFQKKMNSA